MLSNLKASVPASKVLSFFWDDTSVQNEKIFQGSFHVQPPSFRLHHHKSINRSRDSLSRKPPTFRFAETSIPDHFDIEHSNDCPLGLQMQRLSDHVQILKSYRDIPLMVAVRRYSAWGNPSGFHLYTTQPNFDQQPPSTTTTSVEGVTGPFYSWGTVEPQGALSQVVWRTTADGHRMRQYTIHPTGRVVRHHDQRRVAHFFHNGQALTVAPFLNDSPGLLLCLCFVCGADVSLVRQ